MIWIGTSGYNYPEWKGSFYPADLAAAKMLPYYAARFPTVEINYTFYRMPTEKLVSGWAAQTPSPYKLTLKAPRRITHDSRLKNVGDLVAGFCQVAGHARRQAGRAAVPAAAEPEEGPGAVRRVSRGAAAEGLRGVRVQAYLVARRRDLRASGGAQPGAVRGRQRKAVRAGADHGRLRVLQAARRGLHARRHPALGRHDRARDRTVPRVSTSTSSTRTRGKALSSPSC